MTEKIRSKNFSLAILAAILLLLNIVTINIFELEVNRIVRIVSILIIFSYFLYHKGYFQSIIFVIFIIIAVRDILLIQYENPDYKTITFLLTILLYATLISLNIRKINLSRSTPVIVVFIVCMIAINAFNVYYLSDVIENGLDNNLQYILFFVQGAVLILLGFIGFLYNERYSGKTPLIYLYMCFSFIMADLSGLAAYYFKVDFAYFPERCFYILAVVLLANYAENLNNIDSIGLKKVEKDYLL